MTKKRLYFFSISAGLYLVFSCLATVSALEISEDFLVRKYRDFRELNSVRQAEGIDTGEAYEIYLQAKDAWETLGDYDLAYDLIIQSIDALLRAGTASGDTPQIPRIARAEPASPAEVTALLTAGGISLGFSGDGRIHQVNGVAGSYEGGFFAKDMFADGQPEDIFTGTLTQIDPGLWRLVAASSSLQLDLEVDIEIKEENYFTFHVRVASQTPEDRAILLALKLPLEATTWHEDLRVSRSMADPVIFQTAREWKGADPTGRYVSIYPFGAVDGYALAVPTYPPRIFRIHYTPEDDFFSITYEFGLSDIQAYPHDADCTFHLYDFEGREGLRSAARAYHRYELFHADPEEPLFTETVRVPVEYKGILSQNYSTEEVHLGLYKEVNHGYLLKGIPDVEIALEHDLWTLKYNTPRIPLSDDFMDPELHWHLEIEEIESILEYWEVEGGPYPFPSVWVTLGDVYMDEFARAMLGSWARNAQGEHYVSSPDEGKGHFPCFLGPGLENGIRQLKLERSVNHVIDELEAQGQYKHALFQDVVNEFCVIPNAHPEHLPLVDHPLIFDHDPSSPQLYTLHLFDLVEYYRTIRQDTEEPIFINTSPFPHHSLFLAPFCSAIGTESLPADFNMNLWRVVADGKLIGSSASGLTSWVDGGKLSLFYGAFLTPAGVGTPSVVEDLELHAAQAAPYYHETERLNQIGWNAETRAIVLDPEVWIESWGAFDENSLTLTLRHEKTRESISTAIQLDPDENGIQGPFRVPDPISGQIMPVEPVGTSGEIRIPFTIGPSDTRAFGIEAIFTLELDASYEPGTLDLVFTLGTLEPATWVNYLIVTYPTIQILPLWSVPLPAIDPPLEIPISFPFPAMGWVGIWTGLFAPDGSQSIELAWVATGW